MDKEYIEELEKNRKVIGFIVINHGEVFAEVSSVTMESKDDDGGFHIRTIIKFIEDLPLMPPKGEWYFDNAYISDRTLELVKLKIKSGKSIWKQYKADEFYQEESSREIFYELDFDDVINYLEWEDKSDTV